MFRVLSIVCILALVKQGLAVPTRTFVPEETLQECRNTYSGELNNDFLLGTWYQVMKFTFFSNGVMPSATCPTINIYHATADNLKTFNEVYSASLTLDDNPVMVNRENYVINLIAGHVEAKEHYGQEWGFAPYRTVMNYKKLNDEYVLVWDCAQRGMTIWVHSRIQHPTNEEIAALTAGVPELVGLDSQRFCRT